MKSIFFLASLLLCFSFSSPLFAQDNIPLRIGEREGYVRVTFGWNESVGYNIAVEDSGRVIITFDKSATSDSVDVSSINNISAIDIISNVPFKLALTIPKSSKVRDFKIGKRIVLDIYDPEDPLEAKAFNLASVKLSMDVNPLSNSDKQAPKQEAPKDISKEVKKQPPKKAIEYKKPIAKADVNDSPPSSLNIILVPEPLQKIIKKPVITATPNKAVKDNNDNDRHKKKLDDLVSDVNHVVSVRSIKSLDLAIFENFGELWLVIGDNKTYIAPDLSSPNADMFSDFNRFTADGANVHYIDLPDKRLNMQAKGGKLAWDVIMGDKVKEPLKAQAKWSMADKVSLHSGTLFLPLEHVKEIVDVKDILTGQVLKVAMVERTSQTSIDFKSYVDFDVLRSPIGVAIRSKVDDLQVKKVEGGLEISRPHGLAVASAKDIGEARIFAGRDIIQTGDPEPEKSDNHEHSKAGGYVKESSLFFRFNEWKMGVVSDLNRNDNILLSGMKDKSKARRVEDILTLGKMFLSHARGAEALGYFNYALLELPELNSSSEFRALRGLSEALDWKSDIALRDFLYKGLEKEDEIKYWKSYVLADLGDWHQAVSILPNHYKPIYNYPAKIGNRLALVLSEVNLRAGNVAQAEELMALVENREDILLDPQKAALKYLRGEAYRQKGELKKTIEIWTELTQDKDDLYRTKSGLALTILLGNEGKIKNDEVINRLERLRYAWRGDELEAQINYWLGKAYFKNEDYVKGLHIMRDASSIAGDSNLGQRITKDMAKTFADFYLNRDLKDNTAIDAVTLYEQFSELTPVGKKGDKLIQMLAENLVHADLLGRATKLLRHQIDHRLEGRDKMLVAIRLAAIELIDKKPQKAVNALRKASSVIKFISDPSEREKRINEIALLKIRAYSQNKQFDKALSLLGKLKIDTKVNRLKADISWQASYWDIAAESMGDVIVDENISMTRPLSGEQTSLIMNRAIALSLSGDRIALANMRKKYSDLMIQTNKAHQFEVITRSSKSSALADRETLLSIVSEVDLFKKFLDSYRANQLK